MGEVNMTGSYNDYIVAFSVVIVILASYSALNIADKISNMTGKIRFFWLLAGAIVMGSGVWSLHFMGMFASQRHVAVKYDVWLIFLSIAVIVISSYFAFYITMPKNISGLRIAFGGLIMGGGILAMQYIGMEAMIMNVAISYDITLWLLSTVIALVASCAAIFLFLRFRNQASFNLSKWLSAAIIGFAVYGMHYTGMAAISFHVHESLDWGQDSTADFFLLTTICVTILIIFVVSWGVMYLERHALEKMAYQDSVTGLPNRNEMNRFFDNYHGHGHSHGHGHGDAHESIGVLFLDLDRFKAVNDTLGHSMGDLLVQEVGYRLRHFISEDQKVFRIGGDEFLFIVVPCDLDKAKRLAENILSCVKQVYLIEENELHVTGSIGISLGSIRDSDRSYLLGTADTAMYKAKESGKNQYSVYNEEMGIQKTRKLQFEKDFHN